LVAHVIGSWALASLGVLRVPLVPAALAEDGRIRWSGLRTLRPPSPVGRIIAVLGGLLGLYVAGYTGVLLAVTNRPICPTHRCSACCSSCRPHRRRARDDPAGVPIGSDHAAVADLHRMDDWVIALELLVLIAVMVSLGRSCGLAGCLGDLARDRDRPRNHCAARPFMARTAVSRVEHGDPSPSVLVGGFLLRIVIVSRHNRCEMNRIALFMLVTGVALVSAVSVPVPRPRGRAAAVPAPTSATDEAWWNCTKALIRSGRRRIEFLVSSIRLWPRPARPGN